MLEWFLSTLRRLVPAGAEGISKSPIIIATKQLYDGVIMYILCERSIYASLISAQIINHANASLDVFVYKSQPLREQMPGFLREPASAVEPLCSLILAADLQAQGLDSHLFAYRHRKGNHRLT